VRDRLRPSCFSALLPGALCSRSRPSPASSRFGLLYFRRRSPSSALVVAPAVSVGRGWPGRQVGSSSNSALYSHVRRFFFFFWHSPHKRSLSSSSMRLKQLSACFLPRFVIVSRRRKKTFSGPRKVARTFLRILSLSAFYQRFLYVCAKYATYGPWCVFWVSSTAFGG